MEDLESLKLKTTQLLRRIDHKGVIRGPLWEDIEFAEGCKEQVELVVLDEGCTRGEGSNAPENYFLVRKPYSWLVALIYVKGDTPMVKRLRAISRAKDVRLNFGKTTMRAPEIHHAVIVTGRSNPLPIGTYNIFSKVPGGIPKRTTEITIETPSILHLYNLVRFLGDTPWPQLKTINIPLADDCYSNLDGNMCMLVNPSWSARGFSTTKPTPLEVYFPRRWGRWCLERSGDLPERITHLAQVTLIDMREGGRSSDFFGEALRKIPGGARPTLLLNADPGFSYSEESKKKLIKDHRDILGEYAPLQLAHTWEFLPPYERKFERVVICNKTSAVAESLAKCLCKEDVLYEVVHRLGG